MDFTNLIRLLPDVYKKDSPSFIAELIKIIERINTNIMETYDKAEKWRCIDEARGATLDLMGLRVGQKRGSASDEIYRVLIKARIARNNSDGTINSIIEALALSLSTTPDTIKIKPLYTEGQPLSLRIEGIPITALNKVGLTIAEFGSLAQSIAISGMKVSSVDLSGTFAFSSKLNQMEDSVEFGFAPLDRSTGGTLGSVAGASDSDNLPIA